MAIEESAEGKVSQIPRIGNILALTFSRLPIEGVVRAWARANDGIAFSPRKGVLSTIAGDANTDDWTQLVDLERRPCPGFDKLLLAGRWVSCVDVEARDLPRGLEGMLGDKLDRTVSVRSLVDTYQSLGVTQKQ